ncbi:MAG TPA: hypothetical protein VGM67_08495 [Gemmatimonadaceae bacterium]|jgi:hypothetical protein
MMQRPTLGWWSAVALTTLLATIVACGSSVVGYTGPTTESPAAPSTCSATPIGRLKVTFNGPTTVQLYGETFTQSTTDEQVITRDVVPCDYDMTVQITSPSRTLIGFGRTDPWTGLGGVEPTSITTDEDSTKFSSDCVLSVGGPGFSGPGAPPVHIHFKVSATGSCR